MKTWLQSFFDESPGVGSMIRLIHWWAFVFCIAAPITVELIISLHAGHLVPIDSTISVFCLSGFGTATAGKVVQGIAGEKPTP